MDGRVSCGKEMVATASISNRIEKCLCFFKGLFLRIFFAVAIQKVLIKPSEELALSVFTPEVQRL